MHYSRKKGEAPAFNVIIYTVLGLVFLALFIGILVALKGDVLNKESAVQTGCWLSNTIKCGGGIFSAMPSLCSLETVEEELTKEKLADLTRDTWWMFKEGKCDFGTAADEVYPVYAFTLKEEILLGDFMAYILTHNKGEDVKGKIENSDYTYLEKNTPSQTICFDKHDGAIEHLKLESGKPYYLLYYDDQELFGASVGDRILISSDPSFDKDWAKNVILGTTVGAVAATVAVATIVFTGGGASIAITTGGITSFADIIAGGTLYIASLSTKTILIGSAATLGTGASGGTIFLSSEFEGEGSCLVYGPPIKL